MLPALKNGKGSVVHIPSIRAHQSGLSSEPYVATKAELLGLVHLMVCSFSCTGVCGDAILLGWVNVANEWKEADEKDDTSKEDHRWHWAGRIGKVDDILKAVEYLVEADFVTGQEIVIDGGLAR